MLFNLHPEKALCAVTSVAIAAQLAASASVTTARAEPPHLANYWEPTRLGMHACLQRGMTVLRQIGFADAHLGKSGEVVFGSHDDSHMAVICSIPHWVVFAGASPSLEQIANYRNELVRRF